MSKVVIIGNNKLFIESMKLNINTYFQMDVLNFSSIQELVSSESTTEDFKLMVLQSGDKFADLNEYIKTKQLSIPVSVMHKGVTEVKNKGHFYLLPEKLEAKKIIKALAVMLNLKAEDLANKEIAEYLPITIEICVHMDELPCDIYLKLKKQDNDSYVKRFYAGNKITEEEVKNYTSKNITNFYVHKENQFKFVKSVNEALTNKLKKQDLSQAERFSTMDKTISKMQESLKDPENVEVTEEFEEMVNASVESSLAVVKSSKKMTSLITNLVNNKASYCYKNIQLITFIGTKALELLDWGTPQQAEKISFVAMFHDILLTKDEWIKVRNEKELAKLTDISDQQRDLIRNHAYLATQVVQSFNDYPMGVEAIILEHHGVKNGHGFAESYTNNISPLAIIIIIAEAFSRKILEKEDTLSDIESFLPQVINELHEEYPMSKYREIINKIPEIVGGVDLKKMSA